MKIVKLAKMKERMSKLKDQFREIEAKKVRFQKEINRTPVLRESEKINSNQQLDYA